MREFVGADVAVHFEVDHVVDLLPPLAENAQEDGQGKEGVDLLEVPEVGVSRDHAASYFASKPG